MEESPFEQGKIAEQRVIDENGLVFPTVLLPHHNQPINSVESFVQTIRENREWIDHRLEEVGALIFRGFPLKTPSDFNAVMEAFGWEEFKYTGGASRTRIQGRVYTANEAPLDKPIHFHHEMSMFDEFPTKLAFFCEIAPPEGGQTAILLSHNITERMEQKFPELVKNLAKEGLVYHGRLPPKDNPESVLRGWQTLYGTEDKEEAEKRATNYGFKSKVSWEGNTMIIHIGSILPIREVEGKKNCKAWFNLRAFRRDLENTNIMGDGSLVPREAIESCIEMMEEEAVDVKWEVGDVVVIDNRFVQHARRPSKPPRRVLAAFCK